MNDLQFLALDRGKALGFGNGREYASGLLLSLLGAIESAADGPASDAAFGALVRTVLADTRKRLTLTLNPDGPFGPNVDALGRDIPPNG